MLSELALQQGLDSEQPWDSGELAILYGFAANSLSCRKSPLLLSPTHGSLHLRWLFFFLWSCPPPWSRDVLPWLKVSNASEGLHSAFPPCLALAFCPSSLREGLGSSGGRKAQLTLKTLVSQTPTHAGDSGVPTSQVSPLMVTKGLLKAYLPPCPPPLAYSSSSPYHQRWKQPQVSAAPGRTFWILVHWGFFASSCSDEFLKYDFVIYLAYWCYFGVRGRSMSHAFHILTGRVPSLSFLFT